MSNTERYPFGIVGKNGAIGMRKDAPPAMERESIVQMLEKILHEPVTQPKWAEEFFERGVENNFGYFFGDGVDRVLQMFDAGSVDEAKRKFHAIIQEYIFRREDALRCAIEILKNPQERGEQNG